ncbi:hypothetical protein ACRTEV_03520 [Rossellomorea arthrocnemi]
MDIPNKSLLDSLEIWILHFEIYFFKGFVAVMVWYFIVLLTNPAEITYNPAVFLNNSAEIINNPADSGDNPSVFFINPAILQ